MSLYRDIHEHCTFVFRRPGRYRRAEIRGLERHVGPTRDARTFVRQNAGVKIPINFQNCAVSQVHVFFVLSKLAQINDDHH